MNYDVYVARLSPDAEVREYAVEIQPPLASLAVEGLIKRLTTRSEREWNTSALAEDVSVVRQDVGGTALIITCAETDWQRDAQSVGDEMKLQLNPCNLPDIQITTHTVAGHYGLPVPD